jgi:tRNA threonylcarbamoyladenosine biosynthesis protein TsaE
MVYPFSKTVLSEDDTIKLAVEFAESLKGNEVIVLNGNLGSGKTFFVKNVCKVFDIDNVVSPTFAIVNEHDGKFHINHFDFYRINNIKELYNIGFDDYLNNEAITFIEWGNLFPDVLPGKYIEISIDFDKKNLRVFNFIRHE